MSSNAVGISGEGDAVVAAALREVLDAEAAIAAAEVAKLRALGRVGLHAEELGASTSSKTKGTELALRSIAAEFAAAMRVSDRTVQRQIGEAVELVEHYPQTLNARGAGEISRGHVRAVTDAGSILPPEARAQFDEIAAVKCQQDTPGRVKPVLERMAERLHPRSINERHAEAREKRRVCVTPLTEGMAELTAILPTLLADAVYDRLTQQARALTDVRKRMLASGGGAGDDGSGGGDTLGGVGMGDGESPLATDNRTMDQLRADILADMLLTSQPTHDPTRAGDGPGTLGAIRATVQIVVPALSLLGTTDDPGDLVGRSPIDPALAAQLAGATPVPWTRVITDPVTGAVLYTDTYTRNRAIDRYLKARDRHCRFPGCRRPAIRCDVDHTIDWAKGGPTDARNMCCVCEAHHTLKHATGWTVRQLGGGRLEWTSPLGKVYIEEPPQIGVVFTIDDVQHLLSGEDSATGAPPGGPPGAGDAPF
jgi:hypothetical protein